MPLTNLLVPTFTQMLKMLSNWLAKAQTQLPEVEAETLLSARLAPEMFPLSTQIRFTCIQALEAMHRLRGETFHSILGDLRTEALEAGERPGTIAQAKARIEETLKLLAGIAPDTLDGDEGRPIAHEIPNGMIFDMTAGQYARDWALPQFYFHVMAAYAILRNQGVDLGKADYVAHMFQYIRPDTIPKE